METVYCVDDEDESVRIDRYLCGVMPDISRTYIQKLLRQGNILVNGKQCKPRYVIRTEDKISIDLPEAVSADIQPENLPLDILYEDDDLLVVNKPKNMVVHPAPGHMTGTLVNALMYHCGRNLSGINGVLRPGIVHRIDKDTTGSLIVCKNDSSHKFIAEQLKEHSITRKYIAIVNGKFSSVDGTVDAPIGRNKNDRKKMTVRADGKRAVTHYRVLTSNGKYSFIECELETGRTHQIRVHMEYINHPVLGDPVYNNMPCPYNLNGQTLHALTIGFIHPSKQKYMEFEAPVPEYFRHLLEINNLYPVK